MGERERGGQRREDSRDSEGDGDRQECERGWLGVMQWRCEWISSSAESWEKQTC